MSTTLYAHLLRTYENQVEAFARHCGSARVVEKARAALVDAENRGLAQMRVRRWKEHPLGPGPHIVESSMRSWRMGRAA